MNIYDLNHWEDVNEAIHLVGGAGNFDVNINNDQYSFLTQYGFSSAEAEAQFGGATAVSIVVNTANVTQVI